MQTITALLVCMLLFQDQLAGKVKEPCYNKEGPSDSLSLDHNQLLLIKRIPIGATYEQVKSVVPTLGKLLPEGRSEHQGKRGLFEALTQINILDQEATLEFNFEYGELYSYFYSIKDLDKVVAEDLYARLQGFYRSQFGDFEYSVDSDPAGFRVEMSIWDLADFRVGVANNIYSSSCVLSWGFEKRHR